MKPQAELNFDVVERIIGIIANEDWDHITSLRNLSLTCKSMVPLCRKYLFSTLYLGRNPTDARLFKRLILDNPEITSFITALDYDIFQPINMDDYCILDVLKNQSVGLQTIRISSSFSTRRWSSLPAPLQTLLEELINLTTVTDLELSQVEAIPSSIFATFNNLTNLTLHRVGVHHDLTGHVDDTHRPEAVSLVRGRLNTLCISIFKDFYDVMRIMMQQRNPNSNQTLVDFSSLTYLECFIQDDQTKHREVIWQLLRFTTSLKCLKLTTREPIPLAGLGVALSTHTISSLRNLTISLTLTPSIQDSDPLCGLTTELRLIAGENNLEEIHLRLDLQLKEITRPEAEDDWSALDSLLTTSRSFPMLKLVGVLIAWQYIFGASEEVVYNAIRKDHFPRLLKSDNVEFRFLLSWS